jgi:Tol biopolymer transport system component
MPRIAILNTIKHTVTFLTEKAFCVSPAYCQARHKIAYCKRINGVQQIFSYDLNTKEHIQLTTSAGDKDECSWSPCGNYLIFTQYTSKGSRIAIYSLIEQEINYLTPIGESWSFPAWSPCYEEGLFVEC